MVLDIKLVPGGAITARIMVLDVTAPNKIDPIIVIHPAFIIIGTVIANVNKVNENPMLTSSMNDLKVFILGPSVFWGARYILFDKKTILILVKYYFQVTEASRYVEGD